MVFLVSAVLALAGLVATAVLLRRPSPDGSGGDGTEAVEEDTRSA